jgi:hypothetical protein
MEPPMKDTLAQIARRADAFCARLNDGLAAVAIVLAVITTAALMQRLPVLLAQVPPAVAATASGHAAADPGW